jgi:hypothetical protein
VNGKEHGLGGVGHSPALVPLTYALEEGEAMRKVFLILLILAWPFSAWAGTTYYVSNANPVGSDSNSGTSTSNPWLTIAKVNASTFQPGDSILFNSGCTWREQLTVPSSGTSGNPITFGAYGSGANPIITGANLVTSWSLYSGNIWQAALATQPTMVLFNGALGTQVSSAGALIAAAEWYWASNVLYVYSTASPSTVYASPGIESSYRQYGMRAVDKSNFTIQNITIQETILTGAGVSIQADSSNTISNITVQNVTSSFNGWDGFIVTGDNTGTASNVQFLNCTASYNGRAGFHIYETAGASSGGFIYHNCLSTYSAQLIDHHGFSAYFASNVKRYNCEASYTGINPATGIANSAYSEEGHGLVFDNGTSNSFNYACYAHNNVGYGIQACNGGSHNTIEYCVITARGGIGSRLNGGIIVYGNAGSSYISLYNNTIYSSAGGGDGISITPGVTGSTISIENNISFNTGGWGINNFSGAAISASYNLFSPNGDTTSNVTSTNEVDANPLFTNGSGSFSLATDFTLQSGSPAIMAGLNVGLTTDYAGNAVPSVPDIGAYEYVAPITPPTGLRLIQ